MRSMLRRALSLTRHASVPDALCQDCQERAVREELASLAHAQDLEVLAAQKRHMK
ncbi:MAG: hypothetical protein AAF566_04635 [Pseudomonadota bacterium]